jgi:hypothetical protein
MEQDERGCDGRADPSRAQVDPAIAVGEDPALISDP